MSNNLRKTERPSTKRCLVLTAITVVILGLGHAALADVTLPITAVSFPKEVIPIEAGKIDFWAKLSGFSGAIDVGGREPHFFQIHDGSSTFHAGFNANDGAANGGLVGVAGSFATGTGSDGSWTYADIFGAGHVDEWHHYVFQWNKDGIPGVANGQQKVALFVDGVLNSGSWHGAGTFVPLTGGTVNLITAGNPPPVTPGEVAIDELKIYDGANNLILWNTLGSAEEIAHSAVGLHGSFNGGGGAHFVPGISGNAVMASPVFAIFPAPAPLLLTVTKAGTGTGSVTSAPPGITCGADCTEAYPHGTVVTLTATGAAGSTFTGWSGHADCSDGTVTMDAAKTCTATLTLTATLKTLTVTKAGTGTGSVTSAPPGITCGADCTQAYAPDTVVTLTAPAAAGSTFTGWSGPADCSDGAVRMNAAKTCTATFTLTATLKTLTVTKAGTGTGTVTSTPAGITCGVDCTQAYAPGTVVTLTATPAVGSRLSGWSGPVDCGEGVVRMNAAKTCTATFTPASPQTLTVTKTGTGGGTVTSTPAGITCGADCTEAYPYYTRVDLTATPAVGSRLSGWSGDADCADGAVRMNAAKTCTATFTPASPQTLTVTKAGTGGGTVTSTPAGITCGADCTEAYPYYTRVDLTATPAAGSVFTGWSGHADCTDGAVRLNAAKTCTATFAVEVVTLLVLDSEHNRVLRYGGTTGAFIDEFITSGSGGLSIAENLQVGLDGNLYISSWDTGSVKRYDRTTGAFLGDFVPPHSGGLNNPDQLVFGPDGHLYVSDRFAAAIRRYDGTTGAFLDTFVADGRLGGFIAFTFGPDGHLYASMFNGLQCILRYHGQTGAFMDVFSCPPDASSASSGLAFGADGHLYVGRYHLGEVWRLDATTGAFLGALHCVGDIRAAYLTFGPDGTLYVGTLIHNVSRFDITTGACLGAFVHDENIGPTSVLFVPLPQATMSQ